MSKLTRKIKSVAADHPMLWKAVKKGQEIKFDLDYLRYYSPIATEKASTTEINLEFRMPVDLCVIVYPL